MAGDVEGHTVSMLMRHETPFRAVPNNAVVLDGRAAERHATSIAFWGRLANDDLRGCRNGQVGVWCVCFWSE
jgi:hypothetical protein